MTSSAGKVRFGHNSEINSTSNITGLARYLYFRKENTMIRHASKAICLTLIIILTTGCGLTTNQKAAAIRFSAAAIDLSSLAAEEFVNTRNDVVEINTFRRQLGDPQVGELEGELTLESTKIRVEAVNALKQYGELLHTLTTSSQKEELKNAVESCVASLNKVDGVSLDYKEAGAIAQAVQAVGGLWIEHMRKKATIKVVEHAHPHVIKLSDLMIRSFDPDNDYWSLGYDYPIEALRGIKEMRENDSNNPLNETLFAEASSIADLKEDRFATVSKKIIEAAQNTQSAHDNLRNVFQCDEISTRDIDNFVVKIEEFITIYNILHE